MNIPPIHGISCRENIFITQQHDVEAWPLNFDPVILGPPFRWPFFRPYGSLLPCTCFGSKSACFWGCPKFYGFTWYGLSVVATQHLGRILFSSRKTPLLNPCEFTCLSCVSPQSLVWGKSNTGSTGWGPACLSDSELVRIHTRWCPIVI